MFGKKTVSSKEGSDAAARRKLLGTTQTIRPMSAKSKPVVLQDALRHDSQEDISSLLHKLNQVRPPSSTAKERSQAPVASADELIARRALLQTSDTVRQHDTKGWGAVRQSQHVSKALANQSWTMVVKAIKENDERLFEAQRELARAKDRLAALDAQLAGWDYISPHNPV